MKNRAVYVPIDDVSFARLDRRAKSQHVSMAELFRRAVENECGIKFTELRKAASPFARWEDVFIKKNLDTLGPTEVGKNLKRDAASIVGRAYRLGIRKKKPRRAIHA